MMRPFDCQLSEVEETYLQRLVRARIREGQTLDYKERPGEPEEFNKKSRKAEKNPESWKLLILRAVTAMANANGGYIIIGVSEDRDEGVEDGTPKELVGIEDGDSLETDVKNLCSDCIEPKIVGFATRLARIFHDSSFAGVLA